MKMFLKILLFTVGIIFFIQLALNYYWYSGIIPAKIWITYPINISGKSGFREGCGAAIFRLSEITSYQISKQGIAFFDDVIYARNHKTLYYTYGEWKETPVPKAWTNDGVWPGLSCSTVSSSLLRQIVLAAKTKGSYYSVKDEGEILVIPSLKLVVFSYFG